MTPRPTTVAIWRAGVEAVDAARLVEKSVAAQPQRLSIAGYDHPLDSTSRLIVVGAGKAGAGMALGLERAIGNTVDPERCGGWVNVPADCVRPTDWIHLHPARPAGINLPTEAGVVGTEEILRLLAAAGQEDVVIVLLSGGGSALLTAPIDGVTLAEKQAVTRLLSERGATISELNSVRRQLSRVKGGRLLSGCRARRAVVLIISDVIGDPLETIASGPTVPDPTTPADGLAVLEKFAPASGDFPDSVWRALREAAAQRVSIEAGTSPHLAEHHCAVRHHIIGNNRVACDAAAARAAELGYRVVEVESDQAGAARDVGRKLWQRARDYQSRLQSGDQPVCLISGGEPTVTLARTTLLRRGGRNQELALAVIAAAWETGLEGITILSGGTDGEDGPTAAAGGFADQPAIDSARNLNCDPAPYLAINDSHTILERCDALLRTGPTHTNVMDLRIVLVQPLPAKNG
jgi:glycerate 2-kinase